MPNAAVYIRVSTEDQAEFSPEAQIRAIRTYAEKNNLHINDDHIFKDEGISGKRADKRPAFQRMIGQAKIKPRPFDIILVHKFDRFARSREDSIVYKSLLRKECGIKVVSITEQLEDDKFSVILEAMLEAMAEYYSLNLSEEVKKGMTEKARRGELQTPAPFGYRMINGLLTPQEDEAEMVRQIFHKYANENFSMRAIAKYVNSLGFKTKMGNKFDARLVEYIIYNPTYTGKMRWTPTCSAACKHDYDNPDTMIVEGKHEAIVDKEIWEEANRIIRLKKRNIMPGYDPNTEITTHWLRGVIRCAACNATLIYSKAKSKKQGAYRCSKYMTGRCSEAQGITISRIETLIMKTLADDSKAFSQATFKKVKTAYDTHQIELQNYYKRAERLNSQLDKAKELVLSGIDSFDEYKRNKEKLTLQISEINSKISSLEAAIEKEGAPLPHKKISGLMDILESDAGLSEKNNVIKEVISKVVYSKKNNAFEFYYYYCVATSKR